MQDGSMAIIDVGHGNSAVLYNHGQVVVVDAGQGSALLEFLEQEKITRIHWMLISHADDDHIGGVIGVLSSKKVKIDQIWLNTDSIKGTDIYRDMLIEIDSDSSIKLRPAFTTNESREIQIGDYLIDVCYPTPAIAARGPGSTDLKERPLTSNSMSAVLRLVYKNMPIILFPGDVDQVGLTNIKESGIDTSAPIVVFPHHGGKHGKTSFEEYYSLFHELSKSETIIFSISRTKLNNPQPELIKAIQKISPTARIMCTQLSRHCSAKTPKDKNKHLIDMYSHGKQENKCCAGTVLIEFTKKGYSISPSPQIHHRFIDEKVANPICRWS